MSTAQAHQEFALGSLIVPAENGQLRAHGFEVESLGLKALGLVIESKPKKCLVNFPELNVTLWMNTDEMADVEFEAAKGSAEYQKLIPKFEEGEKPAEIVFWFWKLFNILDVHFVLGLETGDIIEIWDQEDLPLTHYFQGDINTPAAYMGLGVKEFFPHKWKEVENFLGDRLLLSRFLPSGMHKLELAIYLRK